MKTMRTIFTILLSSFALYAAEPPQFIVPGHEDDMRALNELHALHHGAAFTDCTLWDIWLPHATLWTGTKPRDKYREVFLKRRMDAEGFVSMQQHRGMGHSEGWPFPAWQQAGGAGFHFSIHDEVWAIQIFALKALTSTEGWEISGAEVQGIDPVSGLKLKATGDVVSLTTPAFRCGTIVAPFARLEWAARGLAPDAKPRIEWLLEGETEWKTERHASFPPLRDADGMQFANVPLYKQPGYAGIVTRYRITFDRASGSHIDLKSVITAIDTRLPLTNFHFARGCMDYFDWTHDVAFLRENIGRMRKALRFALDEFSVRQVKHVQVPWVGHDGRSGLITGPDGKLTQRLGLGVGNNYWDLVPFGGHDAPLTIYLFDTLSHFAELEREIAVHPEWAIPRDGEPFEADDLAKLADEVRTDFQKRFWSAEKGRFIGWIDLEGRAYDYGFTVVNIDAIYYGLATSEQARSIFDWLDGKREIADDTSRGADIYHWRFAARATTRRNIESYVWPWLNPDKIPWGDQVQDGGAVLGFSYFDLMARLKTNGPDDAWRRLREILAWFREVQSEGGYRAYYAKPGRGTLQGGGPAGGLGMDQEFMESVLVPQVMLYGFLGFTANADGYKVQPRLPKDWPALTLTGIHFHDEVLDITAHADGRVEVQKREPPYRDGRPRPSLRMDARDEGVVLRHGDGPAQCDINGIREASIVEHDGTFHLYYDGCGPDGWLACLATSLDLKTWTKKGAQLSLGAAGEDDAGTATSPWMICEGDAWHMFYVGCKTSTPAPDRIPAMPYVTLKARAASPAGPWVKQKDVTPFRPQPGTYNSDTASPGFIVKKGEDYLMYYSAATVGPPVKRTLALARTRDLNGPWRLDPAPILPLDEQIENSSLYFEPANQTWFLFTNHVGIHPSGEEFTDAI